MHALYSRLIAGDSELRCKKCWGKGTVKCEKCEGHGKLKHFKLLHITWKVHSDDFLSNTFKLPKELIQEKDGLELFSEQKQQIHPIDIEFGRTINEASSVLISKHNSSFRDEQILVQRHTLRAIPFTKAVYSWKNKEGEFYVYGLKKEVYFEDYPQQRCCIC
ncbi:protein SSUH2 [Caerostris darwini]|uniref:Protein SSUH2 n=1 Tax=Caerostris darwini TaxID=1538125 RepID=A0AAV4UU93_9ARAC|nr:protein SSUH2 [Caerostris darwini]